tara:strand:- start:142 stop:1194 length:1053 start_codon:yes stop_codon:yes gene_type:complete
MDLTEEQKALILENKGVISDLTELTNMVFPGEGNLDGRTKEGRAVRAFLLENEIEYETKHVYPKEDIPLTEDQGEFILNSAKEGMDSFQIASILFPDAHVKRGGREFMTVHNYLEATSPSSVHISEDVLTKKYSAPKAISKILKKINDYCSKDIEESKLNVAERKSIESLGGFLSSPRFIQVINNYDSSEDRDLFEAEFIRATWDKPDLTSDEINLYINVCMDYIHLKNIQGAINKLNRMFDDAEDQQDLTVRLAELLKTKSEEYNQCEKRMESLIQKLQGDRSKRISSKHRENASILSLVQLFQEEEERKVMVMMAEMQKKAAKKEADNLESMPEWKARVLGISKGDVI